jgi:hypothetical protein
MDGIVLVKFTCITALKLLLIYFSIDYTFSKLSAPPSNPQTGAFFTSLYGLYPCNFLKFLHKPYAYFNENEFKIPEEFDEETFKGRTIVKYILFISWLFLIHIFLCIASSDSTHVASKFSGDGC